MENWDGYNRPNILIIPQVKSNVNSHFVKLNKTVSMRKWIYVTLYNIPCCKIQNLWYYITTKR